jgi:hypothetical protein
MAYTKGTRFGVFGADSTGEVLDSSPSSVTYRFDHAPEKVWGMKRDDFTKIAFPVQSP